MTIGAKLLAYRANLIRDGAARYRFYCAERLHPALMGRRSNAVLRLPMTGQAATVRVAGVEGHTSGQAAHEETAIIRALSPYSARWSRP